MEVADTLALLVGTWHLDRTIEDHRLGLTGTFVGSADVVVAPPDGHGSATAHYDEKGELCFGTHRGAAARRLLFVGGSALMVLFANGRPFVHLDLRAGAWCSEHLCGADRYEITTLVTSLDVIEERWRVSGPDKSYAAVTTMHRRNGADRQ